MSPGFPFICLLAKKNFTHTELRKLNGRFVYLLYVKSICRFPEAGDCMVTLWKKSKSTKAAGGLQIQAR